MSDGERENGENHAEHPEARTMGHDAGELNLPNDGPEGQREEAYGFELDISRGDDRGRGDDDLAESHEEHGGDHHLPEPHQEDPRREDEPEPAHTALAVHAPEAVPAGKPNDPDLDARMKHLRAHLRRRADRVGSEEAAKLSLVAPFITALGYDVFDPVEVVPGYEAEGVRADYAIFDDDETIRMLIGYVPNVSEVSASHLRKLANGVEGAGSSCAVVTDGRVANVHGLEADGHMDERPLVSVRLLAGEEVPLALHAITRNGWNLAAFRLLGQTERERQVVRDAILAELSDPTSGFLEIVENRLRETGHAVGEGTRLAIESAAVAIAAGAVDAPAQPVEAMPSATTAETDDDRQMTSDEKAAFDIIRNICGTHISPDRVFARPAKSYTAVLLDNNNRRSIARIHFKADRFKYLGTFVGQEETRNRIGGPQDIPSLNDRIIARVHELDRER